MAYALQANSTAPPVVCDPLLCLAGTSDAELTAPATTEVAKSPGPRIVYPSVSALPRIYRSVANPPSSSFPHQPRAPPSGTHTLCLAYASSAFRSCSCPLVFLGRYLDMTRISCTYLLSPNNGLSPNAVIANAVSTHGQLPSMCMLLAGVTALCCVSCSYWFSWTPPGVAHVLCCTCLVSQHP